MSTPSSSASSDNSFTLHPVLAADCVVLGDLPACRVLLMNNQRFPWVILVPMRENLRELTDLNDADFTSVTREIKQVSSQFQSMTGAHKMNIAALGNMVPQLHIHVIARYKHDAAWPNPVWNCGVAGEDYTDNGLAQMVAECRKAFNL